VPIEPGGKEKVVIVRRGSVTRRVNEVVAEADALSVTRRVKVDEPTVIGVPVRAPRTRLNPGGSDPLASEKV